MSSSSTILAEAHVFPCHNEGEKPDLKKRVQSLSEALAGADAKAQMDLLRFRTCCADPRASK